MYLQSTQKILHIRGYFHHNEGCKKALIAHFPAVPLHPALYEVALQQLKEGCTLTDLQEQNHVMVQSVAYCDQPADLSKSTYRWHWWDRDSHSLYCQFNCLQGIKITEQAHLNIDEWLDPDSAQFNQMLCDAVFHYSPRATCGERFEVCIATPEMQEATWKYAHQSQIILDGTFSICDKKIFLFIIMGLDKNKKGVPLAFLLFSAPSRNWHTAAGYNMEIIVKLIDQWKKSLGTQNGKEFKAWVAITDTDLMERGTLLIVFPCIWLLICKFHIRQSWWNHQNKELKGDSLLHIDVKNQLRRVEEYLIHTVSLEEAHTIISEEAEVLEEVKRQGHVAIAEKGLKHLNNYLLGYWCAESLWCSWSDYGHQIAAKILNCTLDGVLPTTNHLESFNGVLKRKHLCCWQRGGQHLQVDVLLRLLVMKILPAIFEQWAAKQIDTSIWEAQMCSIPGGATLLKAISVSGSGPAIPTITYQVPDENRDLAAAEILANNQIEILSFSETGFTFLCHSSLALAFENNPILYTVMLGFDGSATCECLDFITRGGVCKHICVAVLHLNALWANGLNLPAIQLPSSVEDARALQAHQFSNLLASDQNLSTAIAHAHSPIKKAVITMEDALWESDDAYMVESEVEERSADCTARITARGELEGADEDDDESIATDTPDNELNKFDFTSIYGVSRAALDEQTIARVFYELEGAAPKLSELSI